MNRFNSNNYKTPVYYEYNSVYAPVDGQSSNEFQKSRFTKYKNGEKLWEISFDEFSIDGYYGDTEFDGSPVLVYGTEPHANENGRFARIVVLDTNGTILWEAVQSTDNARYRIFEVLSDAEAPTSYSAGAATTSLFREQFTAVLLICEPDSGTPKEFHSVPGSLGDEVYLNNGSVCWFTKDIISGEYSAEPFEIDGEVWGSTNPHYTAVCRFYANIFNKDGSFQEQKKLDLMTELHWGK